MVRHFQIMESNTFEITPGSSKDKISTKKDGINYLLET
ncbi:hypothetical protein B4166_2774 [Caldibacillus thermoamylovorans]|uniref:Uncharacterized protein n=1 Tax=Caldibacillus thermoamylovorans TaxID=35841 RepID=A0ABD4A640_9BACI|nr:hypothetical protein B4166_2774 [Caldibacillus thermoamylovorans]KIO72034.1 hypothetical protein B4167_3216 [Caldibacillus thermoamylovorans]